MSRIALIFCVLFFSDRVYGQEFAFREFSLKKGLPQSQVKAINQDDQGFLWVGTLGGLARFDGQNFKTFTIEQGLLNNRITFIEFIDGTLYVGHETGISVMASQDEFLAIPCANFPENGRFTSMIAYQNRILVASNTSGLYELSKNKLKTIRPKIDDPVDAEEFQRIRKMAVFDKKIFFATRGGVFFSNDLIDFELIPETVAWSSSDLIALEKGILVSNYNDSTYLIQYQTNGKWKFKVCQEIESTELKLQNLIRGQSAFLWSLTEQNTIVRQKMYTPDSSLDKVDFELTLESGLPDETITTIFVDRSGVLWLGTEGKGLFQFLGEAFSKFPLEAPVLTIVRDIYNQFWFGTFNGGLDKMDAFGQSPGLPKELEDVSVWCSLRDRNGNLWFGSNIGLYILNKGKWLVWTTENQPELPDNKISALHEDKNGNVWIGTRKGIAKATLSGLVKLGIPQAELQIVRDLISYAGYLMIATKSNLFRLDLATSKLSRIELEKLSPTFSCLLVDQNNTLWIGSEEGLFIYVDNQIQAVKYTSNSAEKFINFLTLMDDKVLIGTNNGIFEFSDFDNNLTNYEIEHYNESFGLTGTETNIKSAFVERKGLGKMWFGTSDGLFIFDTKKLNPALASYVPKVFLADFEVNFEAFENWSPDKALELKYNQNRLRFVFQVLDLYYNENASLEYRLHSNEAWSTAGSSSEIVFNQLASGTYSLQVRAKSGNDNYSEILTFDFVILTPFYATWWFVLLVILAIGAIAYGVVLYRIQQIRRLETQERLELSNRLNALEQQSLNAAMNRHFIFNALNSIQYFINTQDKLSANKYLSKFAQLIRKNLDSSAAGENQVSLAEEIQRLQLYLSLESMRFTNRFEYVFDIDEEIELDEIKIPPMLFQPFIENAIIHGILPNEDLVGEIRFIAEYKENQIVFTIIDNGVGYSTTLKQKKTNGDHFSHGTSITKSRIEVIRKISGDVISMEGPEDIILKDGSIGGTRVVIKIAVK